MSRQYAYKQVSVTGDGDHSGRVWHVAREGRVIGPLSGFELALAAKDGLLESRDCIWKPGLPRWFAVVEVAGLIPNEPGPAREPKQRTAASRNLPSASSLYEKALAASPASGGVNVGGMPSRAAATSCFPLPAGPQAQAPSSAREVFPQSRPPNWPVPIPDCFPPMDPVPSGPMCNPPSNPYPGIVVEHPSRTGVAQRIAENIAFQIVRLMDQHGVKTFDDIATNERLRGLSRLTFEALPQTVKLALNQTIGRPVIEERIYEALIGLRTNSLSPSARCTDLRQLVLDQAPNLAIAIDAAMASATSSIKALLASKWASLSGWAGDGNPAPGRLPGAAGAFIEMHPAG